MSGRTKKIISRKIKIYFHKKKNTPQLLGHIGLQNIKVGVKASFGWLAAVCLMHADISSLNIYKVLTPKMKFYGSSRDLFFNLNFNLNESLRSDFPGMSKFNTSLKLNPRVYRKIEIVWKMPIYFNCSSNATKNIYSWVSIA